MVYIPDSVTKIDETALGYLYDESGNLLPSDQEILIITDTASSAAARRKRATMSFPGRMRSTAI